MSAGTMVPLISFMMYDPVRTMRDPVKGTLSENVFRRGELLARFGIDGEGSVR